ncbi:MAG: sugar ABC transporter substrate-binding protein [Bacillota bacterium]|nr:sugar ABC transporter substrate-binding protein [Bacillota bacterium]
MARGWKTVSRAASLILAVLLLGSVAATAPVLAAGTTIEFWHCEVEQARQDTTNALLAEFQAANPGIVVKVQAIEENDMRTKLTTAQAARRLPNLVSLSSELILRLGNAGLLDTKAAAEVIDGFGRKDFYAGALGFVSTPEGGHYAVPYTGWVQGIWYRKDWFEAKGLAAPTTWEAILAAAKAFNAPNDRVYGIIIGTSKDLYAEQVFTQFALSNRAYLFSADGKVTFNTPEMVEALRFYKDLANYTPPGPESWREARDLYLNGTCAMMFYSTFIMDDIGIERTGFKGAIVRDLVKKTGFAPFVKHAVPASFGAVSAFGITSTSSQEQVEACKKLIRFLMTKEDYIKLMHMAPGGFNPVLKSVAKSPEFLEEPVLKAWGDTYRTIAEGLDSIQTFALREGRIFPDYGNISAQFIIGEALYNLTEKNWTPEETAEWAQKKMEQTVK